MTCMDASNARRIAAACTPPDPRFPARFGANAATGTGRLPERRSVARRVDAERAIEQSRGAHTGDVYSA